MVDPGVSIGGVAPDVANFKKKTRQNEKQLRLFNGTLSSAILIHL